MARKTALTLLAVALSPFLVGNLAAADDIPIGGYSGSHEDVPRWCGKAYMNTSTSFPPGGEAKKPKYSSHPLLDLRIQPQYSLYDSSEGTGVFIVDAAISHYHGTPYRNSTPSGDNGQELPGTFNTLYYDIRLSDTDELLVSNQVAIDTVGNLVEFDLSMLKPRLRPYPIVLYGAPQHSFENQSYVATTELSYLPAKKSGSTVKLDWLHGGLLVANAASDFNFQPLIPVGFYTSCSGYLNTTQANVTAYKALGFNAVNPVCAFTDGNLTDMFDWLDAANIWYQYDMRNSYLNLSEVAQQIPLMKNRPNLLNYYTGDEPDGWQYALNSTRLAYDLLRHEDPYHPTALVLNCHDYYFREYTAGTDIVMTDPYPVGINATYSRRWYTPVNSTYGDAGCDDCAGELTDVSLRLDDFARYQSDLGGASARKPLWAVLQAFSGEQYWSRDPTSQETWVMMVLSLNHGAKGIMSWTFPTSATLEHAHAAMAQVVTVDPIASFILDAEPVAIKTHPAALLDAAYWQRDGKVLVGVASLNYEDKKSALHVKLPMNVTSIDSQLWGQDTIRWTLQNGVLKSNGSPGLATTFILLNTA